MTSVRSPAALVASLACLASAMILASILVQDDDAAAITDASEGEALRVRGELEPWNMPAERWDDIRRSLSGTTYQIQIDGVHDLVLLTGMEPGWEQQTVVAETTVLLHVKHPDRAMNVIVLAVEEVKGPAILR